MYLLTEWWPRDGKKRVARPKAKWDDDIFEIASSTWMRLAYNRKESNATENGDALKYLENS